MSTVNGFQVDSEVLKYNYESLENYNTPEFSSSSSKIYNVGDYVIHSGKLYKCKTATTGGTWNSAEWETAVLTDDVVGLNSALSLIDGSVETLLDGFGYFDDCVVGGINNDGSINTNSKNSLLSPDWFIPKYPLTIKAVNSDYQYRLWFDR